MVVVELGGGGVPCAGGWVSPTGISGQPRGWLRPLQGWGDIQEPLCSRKPQNNLLWLSGCYFCPSCLIIQTQVGE